MDSNADPELLAALMGESIGSLVPGVSVRVDGNTITLTAAPGTAIALSVTTSPTEPPLVVLDVRPQPKEIDDQTRSRMSKPVRNTSTPEMREFWAQAERAAARVETWPEWKRAGIRIATQRSSRREP